MLKFIVTGKSRVKSPRGTGRMLVSLRAVPCDGFGSHEDNAEEAYAEIAMRITDEEAARFDIDDVFTLRELTTTGE
jgi:hypothetical protein